MAGSLKPNVDGLGAEAKATLLGGSLTAGTPNGLLDGIQGNYNSNTAYWYYNNDYIEISFDTPVNIWRMSDVSYPMHIGALKIERFEENQWVEKTFEQTLESSPTQWSKWISNVPAGRYKFSSTGAPRMDGEWFLESISSPILQFNKMLSNNIPNINSDLTKTNLYLADDNMLYIQHNDNTIKPIYENKDFYETVLFEGAISYTGEVLLNNDINNFDFLIIDSNFNILYNPIPELTGPNDKGYSFYYNSIDKNSLHPYTLFRPGYGQWKSASKPGYFSITFPKPHELNKLDINYAAGSITISGEDDNGQSQVIATQYGLQNIPRKKYKSISISIPGVNYLSYVEITKLAFYLEIGEEKRNTILVKQMYDKNIEVSQNTIIAFDKNKLITKTLSGTGNIKIIGINKKR